MDAAFALARLTEDVNSLVEAGDFEGGEAVLEGALAQYADFAPFLHFQMGRLYRRWNKLSSAIHHFHHAVEGAQSRGENLFLIQILDELNLAKKDQLDQRP